MTAMRNGLNEVAGPRQSSALMVGQLNERKQTLTGGRKQTPGHLPQQAQGRPVADGAGDEVEAEPAIEAGSQERSPACRLSASVLLRDHARGRMMLARREETGDEELSAMDVRALNKCMEVAKREPFEAERIRSKLDDGEPWFAVAESACYSCQTSALGIAPFRDPPYMMGEDDPNEPDKDGQRLLRRMLAAGLSRYEPDPEQALAAAGRASGGRRASASTDDLVEATTHCAHRRGERGTVVRERRWSGQRGRCRRPIRLFVKLLAANAWRRERP